VFTCPDRRSNDMIRLAVSGLGVEPIQTTYRPSNDTTGPDQTLPGIVIVRCTAASAVGVRGFHVNYTVGVDLTPEIVLLTA
jgi:hypothetical protein